MTEFVPGPGLIKEVWVRSHSEARREAAAAAFDAMYAEVVRKSLEAGWDEGFDAGEQDVFEHDIHGTFDTACIQNPHRKETG